MLYISLPEGMILVQKEVTLGADVQLMDVLEDESGASEDILLQTIVKDYLREHHYRQAPFEKEGLTIYHRKPPRTPADFLEYQPNNNGAKPAEKTQMIKGYEASVHRAYNQTRYGQRWFQYVPLSQKRQEKVLEKNDETRENRRKTGDSPNAN